MCIIEHKSHKHEPPSPFAEHWSHVDLCIWKVISDPTWQKQHSCHEKEIKMDIRTNLGNLENLAIRQAETFWSCYHNATTSEDSMETHITFWPLRRAKYHKLQQLKLPSCATTLQSREIDVTRCALGRSLFFDYAAGGKQRRKKHWEQENALFDPTEHERNAL